ncbi:MAG: hypothetical protein OEW87_07300 [Flavobacteriaceae bacterium]|nr:hypothetical protein [Flavobacteriaceae bacterium]
MKNTTKLILFLLCVNSYYTIKAQSKNFSSNEDICYCYGASPLSIVKLDNNWELLLLLKEIKTIAQIDSLGIEKTNSQLKLLEQWGLISKNEDKTYQTSIKLFDSIQSQKLRIQSLELSTKLSDIISPKVNELWHYLKKTGREKNAYSILFSYVIDGMIWEYLEEKKIINSRELGLDSSFWNGEYWVVYPRREFSCGTNTYSNGQGYNLKVNWSNGAIPKLIPFMTKAGLLIEIINDLNSNNKVSNQEAIEVFSKYNFFSGKGELSIPVIIKNSENDIFTISLEIVYLIEDFIINNLDLKSLKHDFGFENNSQAIIVIYHEMMWDILQILERKRIIEKPLILRNPENAEIKDVSDLLFFVKD